MRPALGLALGLLIATIAPAATAGAGQNSVHIQWKLPESQVDAARNALHLRPDQVKQDPASADSTRGFPLLFVLAGIVALPDLANALVAVYKKAVYGTTILNCSEDGKCTISHDPLGTDDTIIVTRGTNVTAEVHNRKSLDAPKWLEVLQKAVPAK